MKCGEVTKLLLEGRIDDAGLQAHLAECPECRATAELLSRLADEGEALRAGDLSPEAIKTTRERAAEILAVPEKTGIASLITWPLPGRVLAAAAVLIVAMGVTVFLVKDKPLPDHPTADELAMQKEITELRCSLMDRLGEFRQKYQAHSRVSGFAVRRAKLQARMNIASFKLKRDLGGKRAPRPVPADVPSDNKQALNIIPTKRRIQDEDSTEDEPKGPDDDGGPGRVVVITHSAGAGAQT